MKNPTPISAKSFSIITSFSDWAIYEIPQKYWKEMDFLPRADNLVGVYGSGCQLQPQQMHNSLVTAGIDAIAVESNPKEHSRYGHEPQLNIYHIVFSKLNKPHGEFEYLAHGPFNDGALQHHWPPDEEKTIEFYINLSKKFEDFR